ncbi:hypothetical protein [Anabaena sp. CCY 0017]|uniref:hypothetical protein n=1 Tax=Anabaena sp. CCY 0017 TaxID=3103866 RepID=UPI0039C72284
MVRPPIHPGEILGDEIKAQSSAWGVGKNAAVFFHGVKLAEVVYAYTRDDSYCTQMQQIGFIAISAPRYRLWRGFAHRHWCGWYRKIF